VIRKFFSAQAHTITGAAILLGTASLLSGCIGLARDRIFAHYFGAGDLLDAYYAAFRIPDFLFNLLLAGAITAGFVPIFLELWNKNKSDAWRITNTIITVMGIAMLCASSALWFAAPTIIAHITSGFSKEKLDLTIHLTRIMLISPILLGISGIISGVLHALRQFVAFSFAPIIYNVGIIFGALFLVPFFGPTGLAWGVVIGACGHLLVQLPIIFSNGFNFKLNINLRDAHFLRIITLVIPRTLSMATTQINFVILDSFASSLATGSITIFYLANNIFWIPIGLIGQSFALAAFPIFSAYSADGKIDELISHFNRVVRQILFLAIPSMLLLILLRAQIVRVALGTGKFNWTATVFTANVLAALAISLAANCIMLITARALFAIKQVWSTFFASMLGVIITACVGLLLRPYYGVVGLGIAMSISVTVQCSILWLILRHHVGTLHEKTIIWALSKISIAALAMAIITQWLKNPLSQIVDMTKLWGILSQGAICGMVGLLTYALICHLLRLEEMELFQASCKKRWFRLWKTAQKYE
jgi:putative peptidoglycan lipid II flippase